MNSEHWAFKTFNCLPTALPNVKSGGHFKRRRSEDNAKGDAVSITYR